MCNLKTILLGLVIALLLTGAIYLEKNQLPAIVKAEETFAQPEQEIPLTPLDYADKYAKQYGVDPLVFKKVMLCESGGRQNVKGDGGRANGVFQFHLGTFLSYEKQLGIDLDYASYQDQIHLAAYMFSIGEARHWTAYRAYMNGGTYSFYSSQLGKHFTVTCK